MKCTRKAETAQVETSLADTMKLKAPGRQKIHRKKHSDFLADTMKSNVPGRNKLHRQKHPWQNQ